MITLVPLGDVAVRFARPTGVAASELEGALRRLPGVRDVVVTEDHAAIVLGAPTQDLRALSLSWSTRRSPRRATRPCGLRAST